MGDSQYIPASPRNITIRPLDKGVVNNVSPGMVPKGGFLEIKDLQVSPSGLEQRASFNTAVGGTQFVQFPPIVGFQEFWSTAGVKRTLIQDRKFFYEVEKSGQEYVADKMASTVQTDTSPAGSSVTVASTQPKTISGDSTNFSTTDVKPGDVIYVEFSAGTQGRIIENISNDTTMTVTEGFASAETGAGYIIQEGLYSGGLTNLDLYGTTSQVGDVVFPDAVSVPGKVIVTDGSRIPRVFDGGTWEAFTTQEIVPVCVGYFRDRLFFGQMLGSDANYYRQRIRWSEAGTFNDLPTANYIDLPYQSGAVWRIVPFAQALVAFFDDAVYIGRATSSSSLPIYFEKIETGGVGLVGMRAIATWMDSIFFTGQDDIYMVTAEEVKPVGTKAVKRSLRKLGDNQKGRIMGYRNTHEGKIGFAIPSEAQLEEGQTLNNQDLNVLWELDIASGAWSKLTFNGDSIGFIQEGAFSTAIEIDDFSGEVYDDYTMRIDNLTSLGGKKRLYFDKGQGVLSYFDLENEYQGKDYGTALIGSGFITGDIDLDNPDMKKLWNRIGMKLNQQLPSDGHLSFDMWVSIDRGQNWKKAGVLKIVGGKDEGKLNFRIVGSQLRVKATLRENTYGRFEIGEITLRAKPRGGELRFE